MKSYEEMTRSVLDKAQICKAAQKRRNSGVVIVAACVCCAVLTVTLAVQKDRQPGADIKLEASTTVSQNEPSEVVGVDAVSPRLVLLCAPSRNDTPRVMEEKIKIPYNGELRVSDISGMTEEEKRQLGKEEAAYIENLWGDFANESGFGRYMLDNVMVTTISVGEFGIRLDAMDMVSRIRVSVTENGSIISYPRVEGCKTSAYTFEDDQQLIIDIDGESLKESLAQNGRDTLGLFWNISPWSVTKLDKDPDMDLSQFSDRITITIDYTDGRVEETTVLMLVDSNGQISAMLEGTTVAA